MTRRLLALAVVASTVWIVGCSSVSPPSPTPTMSSSSESASAGQYDPLTRQLIDDQWAAIRAQYPDAVQPDVSLVRYVAPSEAAPALADCLNSEGFEVSVRTDGNLESDSVPASQQESYAVAMWKCMAMYPYDPKFNQALTDEQIRRVYDYYVNELTPCLEDRGITVTDPPSETTFVEGYYSAPNLWTPYTNLPTLSEAQVAELYAACPAQPSDLFG